MSGRSLVGALLLVAAAAAACGSSTTVTSSSTTASTTASTTSTTALAAAEVKVTVPGGGHEYVYDSDITTVPAGPVKVTLTNNGTMEHQAMLMRLKDGIDLASFAQQAAADPTGVKAISLLDGFGGPNLVAPHGGTSSSTQVLQPGNYLMICFIPGADGVAHAAKGMVKPFTVTGSTAASVPAKAEITLLDFAFATSGVHAGRAVHVVNKGTQVHEVAVYRLRAGATFYAFKHAVLAGKELPADPAGGLGAISPGGSASFTAPAAGEYVLACFMPDTTGSGKNHLMLGMLSQVTFS